MIPRTISAGIAVALMATGTTLASTPGVAAGAAAAATTTPTAFAMSASGYGTKVRGGDIPANSDRTAFQSIGCTNLAGLDKSNPELDVDLSPLLQATAVKTRVWTTQNNGVVSSWAQNRIARARVLGDESTPGTVAINAIESRSRAFHDGSGFHATTRTLIGSITVDPDGAGSAPPQEQPLPTQAVPFEIPGVLRISLGTANRSSDAAGAKATAFALKVELLLTRPCPVNGG